MCTRLLILRENKFIPFKFFLTGYTLFVSLCLENSIIFFFGPLLSKQSQSSIPEGSTLTFNFSNNLRTVPFKSLFSIEPGIPLISWHSRLEHWLLPLTLSLQSNYFFLHFNFVLTCFITSSSDSSFLKSLRKSVISLLISTNVV